MFNYYQYQDQQYIKAEEKNKHIKEEKIKEKLNNSINERFLSYNEKLFQFIDRMEEAPVQNSEILNKQLQKQFRQTEGNKFIGGNKMDTSVTPLNHFQPKRFKNIKVYQNNGQENKGYKYMHIPLQTEPELKNEAYDPPKKPTQLRKTNQKKFLDLDMKYTSLRQKEQILVAIKQEGRISPRLSNRAQIYQQFKGLLAQDKQMKEQKLVRLRSLSEKQTYPKGLQQLNNEKFELQQNINEKKSQNNYNEIQLNNHLVQQSPKFPQQKESSDQFNIFERQQSYIQALSQRNSSPLNKLLSSVELRNLNEMVPSYLEIKPQKKTHFKGLNTIALDQHQIFNQIKEPRLPQTCRTQNEMNSQYRQINENTHLHTQHQQEKLQSRVQRIQNAPNLYNLKERSHQILTQNNQISPKKKQNSINFSSTFNSRNRGNSLGSTLETSLFQQKFQQNDNQQNWQNNTAIKFVKNNKDQDYFNSTGLNYGQNDFSAYLQNTQRNNTSARKNLY